MTDGPFTESSTPASSPDTPVVSVRTGTPRRRRAAARPAGPPTPAAPATEPEATAAPEAPADAGAVDEPAAAAPPAKAKAPARKRTRKAAAPVEPAAAAADETPDEPQSPAEPEPPASATGLPLFQEPDPSAAVVARRRRKRAGATETPEPVVEVDDELETDDPSELTDDPSGLDPADESAGDDDAEAAEDDDDTDGEGGTRRRRRRRGGRRRKRSGDSDEAGESGDEAAEGESGDDAADPDDEAAETEDGAASSRRRRRRRRGRGGDEGSSDDPPNTVTRVRSGRSSSDDVTSLKGSTRLEAKKQRRREGRDAGRRRAPILSEAEFLARREDVERVMVVRQRGERVQIGVLEDDVLVEHYVNKAGSQSLVGNVYLGRVQNVLPSMEAAFVDIGKGRNAVLYAGEVNWDAAGLEGQPKRIEFALKSGDSVLVQVTKDPLGHKGARLTSQISLPGRYLVYVPDGSMTGISRKLPDTERTRLKKALRAVVPEDAGVIVRTAAEGASEEELERDVSRLAAQWEDIKAKSTSSSTSAPSLLYGEPDLAIRVVRDIFNEDVKRLVVDGAEVWATLHDYVTYVAPDLADRLEKYVGTDEVFRHFRIDEQLAKALDRKVWLPSGGSLVIDRTEAMTVVDVNTGKFTGQGGNLEETVTKNNLEAAEEIVRQLRLRDIGGIIVVDFIDMVLESNRDLVLRRLVECLGRDRTKHQVAEVTSLGLVQMTRKRIGQGLLETFSETCDCCNGRGVKVQLEPVDAKPAKAEGESATTSRRRRGKKDPVDAMIRGRDEAPAEGSEPPSEPPSEAPAPEAEAEGEPEAAAAKPKGRSRARKSATATAATAPTAAEEAPAAAEAPTGDGGSDEAPAPAAKPKTRKRAAKKSAAPPAAEG